MHVKKKMNEYKNTHIDVHYTMTPDRTWVPCPTCKRHEIHPPGEPIEAFKFLWAFKPTNETGDWLDVHDYFEVDLYASKLVYTDESLEKLYNDYQIRYTPMTMNTKQQRRSPAVVTFEKYGTYECQKDCYWELVLFNTDNHPFLRLDLLDELPPYGDSEDYRFVQKLNCDGATRQQGLVNLVTLFFFVFGAFAIRWRQKAIAIKFDED
jgi:hypothetical protein